MFDNPDAASVVYGDRCIRFLAFDPTPGLESIRLALIANRPAEEPGFRLTRQETGGRRIRCTIQSSAADRPEGRRYA